MFKRKFFIMSAVIVLVVPVASFGQEFAPGFPLDSLNPFSPDVINSVFDHSHPDKGFEDHRVDAYSGEVGMYHEYGDSKCYMVDESGTPVSLDGNYRGAHGKEYLCYDGHKGIDFKASASLVVAVDAGEIVKKVSVCPDEPMASCGEGFGNWFKIKHINGYTSIYAHLRTDGISGKGEGEHVEKGEPLGYSGNSGHSYGEHLHFEIRKDIGRDPIKVDPYKLWKNEDFLSQCLSGYTNQASYGGNCGERPAGSICVGYPDNYTWLVWDNCIVGWETVGDIVVALGCDADYYHVTNTDCIRKLDKVPSAGIDLGFTLTLATHNVPMWPTLTVNMSGSVYNHTNLDQSGLYLQSWIKQESQTIAAGGGLLAPDGWYGDHSVLGFIGAQSSIVLDPVYTVFDASFAFFSGMVAGPATLTVELAKWVGESKVVYDTHQIPIYLY